MVPGLSSVGTTSTTGWPSSGRGEEGDWEVEEAVEDQGPPRRWEMQPGNTRFPYRHRCGKKSAGCGGRRELGVVMGPAGPPRAERGEGGGGGGSDCRGGGREGATTVPTHALLRGSSGRRVVYGPRFSLLFPLSSIFSRDRPGRRAKRGASNVPPPRGPRAGKPGGVYTAIV